MADSGDTAKTAKRGASKASDQDGVLDARTAQAAELAAEDAPPRRVDALWPETAVTPSRSGDAVTDADKKES